MKVTSISDQDACRFVLEELEIQDVAKPQPPQVVCDFIVQVAPESWVVGTNDKGRYTLHLIEEATKEEAWSVFENIRGPGTAYTAPRIHFTGNKSTAANN
ncbi:MAG TPA: hypothetical protein VFB72_18745 [Verrucomicrobiae bacterium]|nr:hypothetical protein [Verrucomicrobiae bacterium]